MNTTLELIHRRRSLRAFSDQAISPETLTALKEATVRAPTAGNMALYSIVEVEEQEIKDQLAILCDDQPMIGRAPVVWVFLADMQKWVNYFYQSGAVKRATEAKLATWRDIGLGDLHLCLQDAIITAHNSVIAAEALGLGSCYIGDVIENFEAMRDLLTLEQYTIPAAMVIFGYPKGERSEKRSPRPPVDAIFMRDRYENKDLAAMEYAYSAHQEQRKRLGMLPYENSGTIADYYYLGKSTAAFMEEMNRSTEVMFRWWMDGKK